MSYHGVPSLGLGQIQTAMLCITPAQKVALDEACRQKSVIKGVGAIDPCVQAGWPICPTGGGGGGGGEEEEYGGGGGGGKAGTKKAVVVGGILLLVALGGYALYRATKKGKRYRPNLRRRRRGGGRGRRSIDAKRLSFEEWRHRYEGVRGPMTNVEARNMYDYLRSS